MVIDIGLGLGLALPVPLPLALPNLSASPHTFDFVRQITKFYFLGVFKLSSSASQPSPSTPLKVRFLDLVMGEYKVLPIVATIYY